MEMTHRVIWLLCLAVSEFWQPSTSESEVHGEIQSPQYPQPYPPNLLRQWDLWVPPGYQIQLSLTHLDIKLSSDCDQDSLTVLHDQKVLRKFCGQENSADHPGKEPILSPGNKLTLVFQTSDSTAELQPHIGFSATYKAIDIDECSQSDLEDGRGSLCSQICVNVPGSYRCSCHHGYKLHLDQHTCLLFCGNCIFDKHEGHLASPGYPRPSPPFLSCKYIISVEPSLTITLNFTDNFHIDSTDTEQGPSCLHHWLRVTIPNREPIKLCGGKSPGLIATNSNTVRLDYHTDVEGLSGGWSLDYNTSVIDCGEPDVLLNGGSTFLSGSRNRYLSVIQYRCNEPFYVFPGGENVTFTCEADGKWRSNNDLIPTCIPVCGQPTMILSAYERIIGGSDAPDNTIPWQVRLDVNARRGGGMVIADRWILTAAHLLIPVSNETVQIYIGGNSVNTKNVSRVHAASIHIYPEYNNHNGFDFNNDIALIKLQDPITFSSSIMPICLPAEGATYVTGEMGLVSGFGRGGQQLPTNRLRYVQIPVVDQETCIESITSLKPRDTILSVTNNMFCAGVPEGGKDSCAGDGGSPFALTDNGQFWAAGIVSWGVGCGRPRVYGFYTRVANYMDWIKETMQEN